MDIAPYIKWLKISLTIMGVFVFEGGFLSLIFGSLGWKTFGKGIWTGFLVFVSLVMILMIVLAGLYYLGALDPWIFSEWEPLE